jgi:hypothetical protein
MQARPRRDSARAPPPAAARSHFPRRGFPLFPF